MIKEIYYWDIENIGLTYLESILSRVGESGILNIFISLNTSKNNKISNFIDFNKNLNFNFFIADNNEKDAADKILEQEYLNDLKNLNKEFSEFYIISDDQKMIDRLNINPQNILNKFKQSKSDMVFMHTRDDIVCSYLNDLNNEKHSAHYNNNSMYANLDLKLNTKTSTLKEIQNKLLELSDIKYIKKCYNTYLKEFMKKKYIIMEYIFGW